MTATIKDIAKITKLGYATISAYLNGVAVRPKNKEAIETAINELGYVRNEYARGLKTHRSMTIGVLIPELSNTFSTTIISEMEDVLREKGYGIIVCDCRTNLENEKKSLQFLTTKMVDGLIVMPISNDGSIFEKVEKNGIPVVVIDRMTTYENASYILINNRIVAKEAVNKLTAKGHRNIAVICGGDEVYTAKERKLGYKDALDEVGGYNQSYVYEGAFSIEGGYTAMKQIIENHSEVTAIFATNYEMSVGAIIAINELGKHIPQDYSFVGFDNMELSRVFNPKLATVNQPLKTIGKKSAETILNLLNKGSVQTFVLDAEIVEGESIRQL